MPVFSIIIPSFNRASIIHRPLNAVLSQSFKDYEVIIVDDGSTDNTKSIIDSNFSQENITKVLRNCVNYVHLNKVPSVSNNTLIIIKRSTWYVTNII